MYHVAVPEADYAIAVLAQPAGSHGVRFLLFRMLSAVELDCEFVLRTGEVDDVATDRVLSSKAILGS
jgi:hypothetical protein